MRRWLRPRRMLLAGTALSATGVVAALTHVLLGYLGALQQPEELWRLVCAAEGSRDSRVRAFVLRTAPGQRAVVELYAETMIEELFEKKLGSSRFTLIGLDGETAWLRFRDNSGGWAGVRRLSPDFHRLKRLQELLPRLRGIHRLSGDVSGTFRIATGRDIRVRHDLMRPDWKPHNDRQLVCLITRAK